METILIGGHQMSDQILFTPAAILSILAQIDELKDKDIGITETLDHNLQLQVGETTYKIDPDAASVVNVDDYIISDISEINEEAYDDMIESSQPDMQYTTVTSGIIKELVKTLLVGGMVRLTSKILRK